MLYHTVVVLAVALCSANAFVVTAFDDVPDQGSLSLEASCDYRACDQLCRRLGFPGGACVGDRCKCDNFLQSQASCDYRACDQLCRRLGFPGGACVGDRCKCDNFLQSQEDNAVPLTDVLSSIHHNVLSILREKEPENNVITSESEVNVDQDVLPATETLVPEVNMRSSVSRASCDCINRDCDFYCFRKRFIGGICVTGQCRCYK